MSLEQEIASNTTALRALTEAFKTLAAGLAPDTTKPAKATTKTKADAPAATAPAVAETTAPKAATEAPKAEAAAAASPEQLAEIAAKVQKLATEQGRDAVVAALAKFGAKKIPEVVDKVAFLAYVKSLVEPAGDASDLF